MALKYDLVSRKTKIGGNERTIFFARSTSRGVTSSEQVISLVEKISAVSSGDVKSVLDTLSTLLAMEVKAGRTVDLGDLGRFRMSARSKAAESKETFTRENLLTPRIIFVPGRALRQARKNARYEGFVVNTKATTAPTPGGGTTPGGGGSEE